LISLLNGRIIIRVASIQSCVYGCSIFFCHAGPPQADDPASSDFMATTLGTGFRRYDSPTLTCD
jgi:hypothetical protein